MTRKSDSKPAGTTARHGGQDWTRGEDGKWHSNTPDPKDGLFYQTDGMPDKCFEDDSDPELPSSGIPDYGDDDRHPDPDPELPSSGIPDYGDWGR